MPSYTFNVSPHRGDVKLVTVEADRESEAIRQALQQEYDCGYSDGWYRWDLIKRRMDLTENLALSRTDARADLREVGAYRLWT